MSYDGWLSRGACEGERDGDYRPGAPEAPESSAPESEPEAPESDPSLDGEGECRWEVEA